MAFNWTEAKVKKLAKLWVKIYQLEISLKNLGRNN